MYSSLLSLMCVLVVCVVSMHVSLTKAQSALFCDDNLWNMSIVEGSKDPADFGWWAGEVKVLPSLDGTAYPDDFSDILFHFTAPTSDTGVVEITLNRSYALDDGRKTSPTCVSAYNFQCDKSTKITFTPICSQVTDPEQCCTPTPGSGSTGSYCSKSTSTEVPPDIRDTCYTIGSANNAEGINSNTQGCSCDCVSYFYCDHHILSFDTNSMDLVIERSGVMQGDQWTMKMTTAGKFVSGCDDKAGQSYQLQAYVYSGKNASPFVVTGWLILGICGGALALLFLGGWLIFYCCTHKKPDQTTEKEENALARYSESLIDPVGSHTERTCPKCHHPINSERFDQYCSNENCLAKLDYFTEWSQDGERRVENPAWKR